MLSRIIALASPHWRFRSAVTGMFVSKAYALLHPTTTIRERIPQDEGDRL